MPPATAAAAPASDAAAASGEATARPSADSEGSADTSSDTAPTPSGNVLELVFPYGSEKEMWLEAVTTPFNEAGHKTSTGRTILVKPIAMGSGDMTREILEGRLEAHIASPASGVFVVHGNAQSESRFGRPMLGKTTNLVLSPVVIAMWRPMAEAIGWGQKPIGWSDILSLARGSEGWAAYGYPQWGHFKFGHTHPEFSNSGIISLFAIVYAAADKTSGLEFSDVARPEVGEYLRQIERSIVHYGSSTGFLGRKMYRSGPQYLSAAVLYENMVIESYAEAALPFPIVAIYPKEGTFWSDHPVGIVDRDWVTPEHEEAAELYIDYLEDAPQQEAAIQFGFRPGNPRVSPASPIDTEHGVDPSQPETTLAVPSAPVINAVLELFRQHKKHANIVLAVDISGSMLGSEMEGAQGGAEELVSILMPQDRLSLLAFHDDVRWKGRNLEMGPQRDAVMELVRSLHPVGNTSLYDAIATGLDHLLATPDSQTIDAVIVLSDGDDNASEMKLPELIQKVRDAHQSHGVPIFTIGYGSKANRDVLREIAEATGAKFYEGNPETIREVFKTISTFF